MLLFFYKKEKNCLFLQAQYAVCFVCISYHDTYEFQEKFERDQQRIRQQYEEEKRRAREAEKQREEQVINEVHRRYLFFKHLAILSYQVF